LNEEQSTNIDLTQLATQAREASTRELAALITQQQEKLVENLCGQRYSRDKPYTRCGTYTKTLVTTSGTVKLRVRYSRDVRWACVEHAVRMSYGKASECIHASTGVKVPKRTIHRWVNQLAPSLLEGAFTGGEAGDEDKRVLLGDSTDVRGTGRREMRHVRVLMDADGGLEALRVDEPWPRASAAVLVSDEEPGLVEAVDAGRRQLCVLHGLKRLGFILWRDGMCKAERDAVKMTVKGLLFGLVRHVKRGDMSRLRRALSWTRGRLVEVALDLRGRGYGAAGDYLGGHVEVLVA
jgi:hypothetical protein